MLGDISAGVAWGLAVLYAIAVMHKARMLVTGTAASEPLLPTSLWKKHATAFVAVLAALETAIIVVLLLARPWGLAVASLTIAGYSAGLRLWAAPDSSCHCFGASSRTSVRVAVWRNLVLAAVAAAAAGAAVGTAAAEPERAVAVALVLLSIIAALEAVERLPRPLPQKEST